MSDSERTYDLMFDGGIQILPDALCHSDLAQCCHGVHDVDHEVGSPDGRVLILGVYLICDSPKYKLHYRGVVGPVALHDLPKEILREHGLTILGMIAGFGLGTHEAPGGEPRASHHKGDADGRTDRSTDD